MIKDLQEKIQQTLRWHNTRDKTEDRETTSNEELRYVEYYSGNVPHELWVSGLGTQVDWRPHGHSY